MMDARRSGAELPRGNRIIYDWISISSRVHDPRQLIELIGMSSAPWEILTSGNGYTHRYYFGGISISFCDGDMSHVRGFYLLDMSGQGCRTFETFGSGDYDSLFALVRAEARKVPVLRDVRITRLDVAYDDLSGALDLDVICDKTRLEEYVSRFQRAEAIYSTKGNASNFGTRGGNIYVRIYDKAKERGFVDGEHWIRCELQLRAENAFGFVVHVADEPLGMLYCKVLKNYLSFRDPSDTDSNKRRWEESAFWTAFLHNASAVSLLDKPGVIYNLDKCTSYVLTQPVGSIKTLIKIHGPDAFIDLVNNAPDPKNPKYRRLISEVEQQRAAETNIRDQRARITSDDDDIVLEAEFQDDHISELRAILLDSQEKARIVRFESDRVAAREYLHSQGLPV